MLRMNIIGPTVYIYSFQEVSIIYFFCLFFSTFNPDSVSKQ